MNTVSRSGSSTIERINTLLLTNMKNILNEEKHNNNCINLYDVGEYWVAFEKSAYQLEKLAKDEHEAMVLYIKNHPFPIVMQSIHHKRVNDMCHNHIMTKKGLEYLQLVTRPIDKVIYDKWYKEHMIEYD
ncbi:MAG: hypothetical protein IJZ86_02545 [Bacteroides sp.]|nr:hypothetical protein [Bacteroides sp.]